MALSPRLELRQTQGLVMTPQLQQAIKLLQLSNIELDAYVAEELEKNPLLERDEGQAAAPSPGEPLPTANDTTPVADSAETNLQLSEDMPAVDAPNQLDTAYENLYDGDSGADIAAVPDEGSGLTATDWGGLGGSGGSFDAPDYNLDERIVADETLRDHLTSQLHLTVRDARGRIIGAQLIDCVDDAGYLTEPLVDIADRVGCGIDEVECVLQQLQTFDPTGVMARDLRECLALQLEELDRLDPAMRTFLENLDLLAKHDSAGLMRLCEVDAEDLADMISEIRQLNPKPGLVFGGAPVQPVVPDVFVRRAQDGGWTVELNSSTLPRVLVDSQYCARIDTKSANADERAYISECLSNANWLVKSLAQRARTILKVSSEIVRQQNAFFEHGVSHLKPLNLRTIAEEIEMHESTVSRVTANKYMATSRGIYGMKYFFTASIASSRGGEAHSAESVRHRIKALIDAEPPEKILSDDKIVTILRGQGVDIARRTVAKYREAMNIPSSVQRRRQKRLPS